MQRPANARPEKWSSESSIGPAHKPEPFGHTMDAMILAAGLGTRLAPLTDRIPKALVEVAGVPMLERVALRLIEAGADRLIINVHHHADQIREFVDSRKGFGVDVLFSHEEAAPLDTGGGLKHAKQHFRRDGDFLLHNVDVLSEVDLRSVLHRHAEEGGLATLAVRPSVSDRYVLASAAGFYCGYGSTTGGDHVCGGSFCEPPFHRVDFCGIHAISPRIFDLMTEAGVFSIIYVYSRLSAAGHRIRTVDIGDAWWMDIGTHESLETARRHYSGS